MATINITSTAELLTAIGTGPGSAHDGDTLSFAAGDYTGIAIDISDGRDLTFVSANAGSDPDNWTHPAVILDRIVSTGSITVDGIHVHATLGGDAHNSPNGPYWQAIGTASAGADVTVLNSILTITADVPGSIPQPFGLNLTYGGGDVVVDHVHFGPFIGLPPENTAYGIWINATAPASSVTITNNEFETGAPKNAAVAFDGQHDGPNIIISGNDFEDPGVSPGAIRFFDFADVLSGAQDFPGVGGNTMHGDGPVVSNESGEAISTPGDDVVGTPGDDTFLASAGNDHIDGLGGSDTIDMGNAGAGGSVVDLQLGPDGVAVSAATGLDTLTSIENAKGSSGSDYLAGNDVANDLAGRGGDDFLYGRGGADHLDGGAGADSMDGGDGDDTYVVDNVDDTVIEGSGISSGTDTVLSSVSVTLADNVENLTLTDVASQTETFETGFGGAAAITNGEHGWQVGGVSVPVIAVDPSDASNHVLKISSNPQDGSFGGPYSPDIGVTAGEPQTTADGDVQIISFRVKPVDVLGDNSRIELDFGNQNGTDRNSFMVIESTAGGVRVAVADSLPGGDFDTGGDINDFSAFTGNRTLISGVSGSDWLNLELRVHYVDGADNDTIDVYLNGTWIGQTNTFENYRDAIDPDHAANAEANQTSRILIRASAGPVGAQAPQGDPAQNKGFFFDDMKSTVTHADATDGSGIDGTGNALNNIITGNSDSNVLTGKGGDDTIHGGGGIDTAAYGTGIEINAPTDISYNAGDNTWVVNAHADGTDKLDGVEIIDDATGGRTLLVGAGGFATIQEAINAAQNGDTIIVAPGTYDEDLVVDVDVTILGANQGHDRSDSRGAESIISGSIHFGPGSDGSTLDGFELTGSIYIPGLMDIDSSIIVQADNITITNSLLDGGDADVRPVSVVAGTEGLSFTENTVQHWGEGIYVTDGSTGSIDHNTFTHNGNGVVSESTDLDIVNNDFSDPVGTGAHIAALPFHDTSIGDFIHDNNFAGLDRPVTVYLNGAADNVVGTGVAETFHGEFVAGPVTIDAAGGNDKIIGSGSGDTLTGGAGNDAIDGGAGNDTAIVTGPATITQTGPGWTVVSADGTDTLTDVEIVQSAGGHVLLVGGGGFATIQEAINAASNGDTIMVAAGTYDEDLNINKAVTILGAHSGDPVGGRTAGSDVGETNIIGHANITALGAVTIDGVRFLNDGTTTGGGPSSPTLNIGTGFDHVITNSIFYSTVLGATADDRAIMLPPLGGGHITISDNLITGSHSGLFTADASWGRGIWSDGGGATLTVDIHGNTIEFSRSGINADMGGDSHLNITGNTFHSDGSAISVGVDTDGLAISGNIVQNIGDEFNFRNLTSGVTFDADAAIDMLPASPANLNNDIVVVLGGSGSDILSGTDGVDLIDGNNHPSQGANTDADTINGRGGNDFLYGRGGNDTIDAGNGDDTVDAGADNDTVTGGAGSDHLEGGAGTDTAVFEHDINEYTINLTLGTYSITRAGETDLVSGFEKLSFNGTVVDIAANPNDLFNTHDPVFTSLLTANLNENAPVTQVVYDADATDADTVFGDIVYSLGTDDDGGLFSIEAATGKVRLLSSPNFEAKSTYTFDVIATQGATHSTQTVTLAINNVDEPGNNPSAVQIEAGATQAPLHFDPVVDPDGAVTYKVTTLPVAGTLFLNGVAVAVNQVLSQADYDALTFSSPETAGTRQVTFDVVDPLSNHTIVTNDIQVLTAVNATYTGDAGANRLDGAGGNDVLNGLGGADTMIGGTGNDIFIVENSGDTTIEQAGQGTDLVYSSVSISLAANIENLTLYGTLGIAAQGNTGNNIILGNAGANVLYGLNGNDTLIGNVGADRLFGGNGNDKLLGGVGNDILVGGAGKDTFVFNVAPTAANRDVVGDFSHNDDTFQLENAIFTKLGAAGHLNADFFRAGAAAVDGDDYLIYNHTNGQLFYDSNANAAGGMMLFAILQNKPVLAANDFDVI